MRANRVDIARNLKIIEGLKVQLLSVIAELFSGLYRGLESNVLEIDMAVEEKLQDRAANPDNSLRQFEEELLEYWRGRGRQ